MPQHLTGKLNASFIAACVLMIATGFPADAEQRRQPQITPMSSAGAPLHAQIKNEQLRLFQYPQCPVQFQEVQKTPKVFRCRRKVANGINVQLYTAVAESMSCAPTSYWNEGPTVYTQSAGGPYTAINVRCRHTD